jgi:hypothetical protein
VAATRQAISPRLAIRILVNMWCLVYLCFSVVAPAEAGAHAE